MSYNIAICLEILGISGGIFSRFGTSNLTALKLLTQERRRWRRCRKLNRNRENTTYTNTLCIYIYTYIYIILLLSPFTCQELTGWSQELIYLNSLPKRKWETLSSDTMRRHAKKHLSFSFFFMRCFWRFKGAKGHHQASLTCWNSLALVLLSNMLNQFARRTCWWEVSSWSLAMSPRTRRPSLVKGEWKRRRWPTLNSSSGRGSLWWKLAHDQWQFLRVFSLGG